MTRKPHPGITMHKLTFGGGFIGLLFTVGCSLIFVLGFPTLWYFVALSVALGLAIAALFHVLRQHRADHQKPLSILQLSEPAQVAEKQDTRNPNPKLCTA